MKNELWLYSQIIVFNEIVNLEFAQVLVW
jgi:hypothetical protein